MSELSVLANVVCKATAFVGIDQDRRVIQEEAPKGPLFGGFGSCMNSLPLLPLSAAPPPGQCFGGAVCMDSMEQIHGSGSRRVRSSIEYFAHFSYLRIWFNLLHGVYNHS